MKRWVFRSVAAISLLLCAATVVLWVRSYDHADYFWYGDAMNETGLISSEGSLLFYRESVLGSYRLRGPAGFGSAHLAPADPDHFDPARAWFSLPGFALLGGANGRTEAAGFALRAWLLSILFALPPIRSLIGTLRKPRAKAAFSRCPICGYDLRATRERCPECGTPVLRSIEI
jgi:hypothetical protein